MPQPSNFNLNSLKGRLAEQLVQDLFLLKSLLRHVDPLAVGRHLIL
jgi:hypothetical protein